MFNKWVFFQWQEFSMVILSGVVTYAAILIYTRIAGLRSFSKMSSADFAMTVAVGSLFASTISSAKPTLILGLTALAALYVGQWFVALLRRKSERFSKLVDNQPMLLMKGSKILDENLAIANVTRSDLHGKLREANAINYEEVLAVVFETTGDISVLHSSNENAYLEPELLADVAGFESVQES